MYFNHELLPLWINYTSPCSINCCTAFAVTHVTQTLEQPPTIQALEVDPVYGEECGWVQKARYDHSPQTHLQVLHQPSAICLGVTDAIFSL